jgi:hypothetical protein
MPIELSNVGSWPLQAVEDAGRKVGANGFWIGYGWRQHQSGQPDGWAMAAARMAPVARLTPRFGG